MNLSVQQYVEAFVNYRRIACMYGEDGPLLASSTFAGRTNDD